MNDAITLLVLTLLSGLASFGIAVGARVVVNDWVSPALLAMKPLSCDFCMASWSGLPFSILLSITDFARADALVVTSVPATGLAFLLLKLKAHLEPPDPVI